MRPSQIQTDDIEHHGPVRDVDIENTPPASVNSSSNKTGATGGFANKVKNGAGSQPLSPRPINIIGNSNTPSSAAVSFHPGASDTQGGPTPKSTTPKNSSSSVVSNFTWNSSNNNNANPLSSTHSQTATDKAARYKDQIFQLNLEIQSLKHRLSLTSSTSKNELLDLLSEKDSVIANKSKQLSALNDKFAKITKAVNSMEREMNLLRKAKKDAEEESKKANRYLAIREKEVNVLVARCATQEEKLNEQKSLRVLERELNTVKKSNQKQMEDHRKEIQGLMGDLQQVGNEKQKLIKDISSLEQKNATLQEELDGTKNDLQEKRDKINHLYTELKDLHESKERESTECIAMRKNLQDVKNELFERETQIDELCTSHKHDMNKMKKKLDEQIRADEEALAELSSTKDSQIDDLKKEIQSMVMKIEHSNEELYQWKCEHEAIEKEYHALQKHQKELAQITIKEAEDIENERLALEEQLDEKKQLIEELSDAKRRLEDENESHSLQASKLKEKLGFLENELRSMTDKEKDQIASRNQSIDTISKLEQELREVQEDKTKSKNAYKARIQELENEASELQQEIQQSTREHETTFGELTEELNIERSKAQNYWSELEQLRAKTLKQDELRQVEINLLEESLESLKNQARSKEKEFLNLKDKELKAAKEKVTHLENKIMQMEKICEETEMDAAMIVDDLNKKIVEASDKHAKLEEEKSAIMMESRRAIETLEEKISTLETDFSRLRKELATKSEQLTERDAEIESLTKKKIAQEESVETWKGELDVLIDAYEKCKTEHAANVRNLRSDYEEFKSKAQRDAAMFQKDYDTLQALAADTEQKYEQQGAEFSITKKTLDEKTRLLADMVMCQKVTETELKEARDMIAELQDVSETFNKQTEDYKNKYQSLQLQMEKDLNKHLDELESRDETRMELEKKIKKMEKELSDLREEVKATAELRATNYLLQDKVDRQEAFLMRKLEKEKKQRLNNVIGSPPRNNQHRSRSATRRAAEPLKSLSQPKPNQSRSHSTIKKVSSSDELEEILS